MENAFIEKWSDDQEDVLKKLSLNSGLMSEHHKKRYAELIESLKWYKVPVICLSGLNSVFSVGLNSYIEQNVVSTLTCLISLLVSVISSIELYLSIQRRSDIELTSYKAFYSLAVKINTTVGLQREHRQTDGESFLVQMISEYQSLFDSACVNGLGEDDMIVNLKNNPLNTL